MQNAGVDTRARELDDQLLWGNIAPPSTDGGSASANAPAAAPVDPAAIGQAPDALQAAPTEDVGGVTYVSASDVDPPAGEDHDRQVLGHHLFPLVYRVEPQLAGKITGMLLELDYDEVLLLLESPEALNPRIVEAIAVLQMQSDEAVADAARAQPQGHAAHAVGPPPLPPTPDGPADPSCAESVAVPRGIVIPPSPRPLNGGIAPVRRSPILPKNAGARTDRGCASAPVTHGDDGEPATVLSHVQEVDTSESGDDDEKSRAFSLPGVSLTEQPGGLPDPSGQGQPLPASLDVTYVQPREGTSRETAAALLPTPDADGER